MSVRLPNCCVISTAKCDGGECEHYQCGCPLTFGRPRDKDGKPTTVEPNNGPTCSRHGAERCER